MKRRPKSLKLVFWKAVGFDGEPGFGVFLHPHHITKGVRAVARAVRRRNKPKVVPQTEAQKALQFEANSRRFTKHSKLFFGNPRHQPKRKCR